MGRIKEAFMIQEEIKDEVKEKFNKEIDFDILDFCYNNKLKLIEVRDTIIGKIEKGDLSGISLSDKE